MPSAKVGQSCVFVDQNGETRPAKITAVYEPEVSGIVEIVGERVDLIYAPSGVAELHPDTALDKYSALHKSQQTSDRNYWR